MSDIIMALDFDDQVETDGLLHHLVCMQEEQLNESCRILVSRISSCSTRSVHPRVAGGKVWARTDE